MRLLAVDAGVLVYFGVVILVAFGLSFWIAVAFHVVRDARRRTDSLVFSIFAAILGFFPPFLGALIYYVVRPPRTIEEDRAIALEEQILLEPVGDGPETRPCPTCGRDIEDDFVICPYCRTQFARKCSSCERTLRLGWAVCPYCAADVGVHTLPHPRTASQ
jgi:RNA polymerase subunit RPABC4/transcription elongation factor Spt4